MIRKIVIGVGIIFASIALSTPNVATGEADSSEPWNHNFERTWSRTDKAVADLDVNRTWMWGPEAISAGVVEPYTNTLDDVRVVQYFDKARMEITADATVPQSNPWYVTNGLLVVELITGKVQTGDNEYEARSPARIGIAGDSGSTLGPTYAALAGLLDVAPPEQDQIVTQRIDENGNVNFDDKLAEYGIVTSYRETVPGIDHRIATPFWEFMNASGLVYDSGWLVEDDLFPNPIYATGYPITEPYWTVVEIDGDPVDVLIQCFERRCLTYTPANPPAWRVEAGNVGRHYFEWRYASSEPVLAAPAEVAKVIVLDPGHDASSGGALGIEYVDTMRTARATKLALEDAGYVVLLTRPDDATILLGDPALMPANADVMPFSYNEGYAHASKIVEFNPNLVISLHYNGSEFSSVAGLTVYFSETGGGQNLEFAQIVRNELLGALQSLGYEPPYSEASPDTSAGKPYGGFATLGNVYTAPLVFESNRLYGIPAVLTEPLFETNPFERSLIADDHTHEAFAHAYVRAVEHYFARTAPAVKFFGSGSIE